MTMMLFTDGTDTVVAADEADARKVLAEHCGEDHELAGDLRAVDPAKELSIHADDAYLTRGEECSGCGYGIATSPSGHNVGCPVGCPTKTAEQWAKEHGRGFLCSKEF